MSLFYFRLNQFDLALKFINESLDVEENNFPSLLLKAKILTKQEAYDKALPILNKLLIVDPVNIEVLFLKAIVLRNMGENYEAKECINYILELDENYDDALDLRESLEEF